MELWIILLTEVKYMAIILISAVFFSLCIIITLLALFGFKQITGAKKYTDEECIKFLVKYNFDAKSFLEKCKSEAIEITSSDNLKLKGMYIEGDKSLNRTMVIVHGYTVSSAWSLQFAGAFLNRGWSVLLVDQRRHGRSEGKYSTYGYMEKYDLDSWVDWIITRNGQDSIIGLHGQSMGGGTVLEYASINKHAKFIIADCPYSDMKKLMVHQIRCYHMPAYPLLYVIDWLLSLRAGFRMKDVSPINTIKDSSIPVMFIHGSEDNFVPTYMSEEMYNAKTDNKRLLIVDGAVHGNARLKDRENYEKEMMEFIDEVLEDKGISMA